MDEKHPNQVRRGVSNSRSVQARPVASRYDFDTISGPSAPAQAEDGSPEGRAASKLAIEQASSADNPAPSTSRPETTKESGELTTILAVSRTVPDRLLAETQSLHERSWRVIYLLLEDLQLRASFAVGASLDRFEDEVRERIKSDIVMMLQNFDIEAGARLTARLDQALATAKQWQYSIEQDHLANAVKDNRKRLDQLSTDAAEVIRHHAEDLWGCPEFVDTRVR